MSRTQAKPPAASASAAKGEVRPSSDSRSQVEINLDHYATPAPGRSDYWKLMAAPRFRTSTILKLLTDANPSRILDIGCGDGTLLRAIEAVIGQAQLTGLDLSPGQVAENQQRCPGITWVAGLAEELQQALPNHHYDAVVASELIEHLADPAAFLRKARCVTATGGVLILSTQSGRVGVTERRVGHLKHFTAAEMESLLRDAGWDVVRVWNAGFPFQDWSKYLANLAPDYSMQRFGERRYGPVERLLSAILRGLFRLNSGTRGAQLFAVGRNTKASGSE